MNNNELLDLSDAEEWKEPNQTASAQAADLPELDVAEPYLELGDSEKAAILKGITDEFAAQSHSVSDGSVEFPTSREGIEGWVVEFSKHFSTERLVEVALSNKEYAPKLSSEIASRKDYAQLEQILQHYKNKPMFEYCVRHIESALKGDELGDNALIALSVALAKTEPTKEPEAIAEHEATMKAEKETARPLAEYQRLLKISDQELQALSGQDLLLIGGGFSPIKSELAKAGVDCDVTNIDPIADASSDNSDNFIKGDFFDVDLGQGRYSEVLALHSLPQYAFSPDQVVDFYSRSLLSLQQGGTLRVLPVDKSADAFTPAMRLSRRPVNSESVKFINQIEQRPDLFSVARYEIEHKGPLGGKSQMPGAKIKVIGDLGEVREFLQNAATGVEE